MTRERAVILARGLGTRMRQATDGADLRDPDQARAAETGAKAMMPISGPLRDAAGAFVSGSVSRPFLDYSLSALADAGYTDVCLVVAPDHEAMARHYSGAGEPRRLRLAFAVQEEPIGTANAVAAERRRLLRRRLLDDAGEPAVLDLAQREGADPVGRDVAP